MECDFFNTIYNSLKMAGSYKEITVLFSTFQTSDISKKTMH